MQPILHGPEKLEDQGLSRHQRESGDRAIEALLCDPGVSEQVDLILTYRHGKAEDGSDGHYEAWSRRGRVRFRRWIEPEGLSFEVVDVLGENPLANQDPHALKTVGEEIEASIRSGFDGQDARQRFIRPEQQSYPHAYERIAQLFDSPHAPDLVISPMDWSFGSQPGTHGGLHVRQSRSPLWFSGPGIRPGLHDDVAKAVDIAPTALKALGFPLINGRDRTGRTSEERGTTPDVYLARQDGEVLENILNPDEEGPERLYLFLLDGLHPTELEEWLEKDPERLPALRRLRNQAAVLQSGSIVNFPSITWPSHTTIATSAWCGHHDVVNPSYYLRDEKKMISPQGEQIGTEHYASAEVESLYEAFTRVRGKDRISAAIHAPFGRGATHAVLEHRNLCDKKALKSATPRYARDEDPRWREDPDPSLANESILDSRGLAQIEQLFQNPDIPAPDFVFHELVLTDGVGHAHGPHSEGSRAALEESDRRIGQVLRILEDSGHLDRTLFIVTSDHGMAPQDADLAANPGRHIHEVGLKGEVSDIMIWLHDVCVETTRSPDRRTGRVRVHEGDANADGDHPPLSGVRVTVHQSADSGQRRMLAQGETNEAGIFGFPTPAELPGHQIEVTVHSDHHNAQQVRMDSTNPPERLAERLYGSR